MRKFTNIFILAAIIISSAVFNACSDKKMNADLVIFNGRIHLLDDSNRVVESLAIKDGVIQMAGTRKEVMRKFLAAETIDLQGANVYPGFIDAHCHFLGYGKTLAWADLKSARSLGEMLSIVKDHAANLPASSWVLGRGWDQNKWPGNELPVRQHLDSLFPDRPVMLVRVDGHAVAVNSYLLRIAGLENARDSRGGEIMFADGRPNGILLETTADRVKEMVPALTDEEKKIALLHAQNDCYAVGLTSVHDAGLFEEDVLLIDSLQKAGILTMHINAMLNPTPGNFNRFVYNGPYITDRLIVRSVKLYADGALGSRGALLLDPYSDMPGTRGISVLSYDSMKYCASIAYEMGYQVCTHAIGDSAVRKVLALYADVLKERNAFRWRIEHCQVVDPADLQWFSEFSVLPSINAVHATSDMLWAAERLGPDRVQHAYAYRSLLRENGWLCNGSDFPVENINPLHGFIAACFRTDLNGNPAGGFQPENALDRLDALKAMTIWAAKAAFDEKNHGSLEPGKRADFVVVDTDLLNADLPALLKAKVTSTYIDGKPVYSSQSR